jgi:hypothetical protein
MKKKKLKLSRETIARLIDRNLTEVAGGRNETTGEGTLACDTLPQGSYVHQTHVYPCNKSAACTG